MKILTNKTLALIISAIKELRETKGSTSREILNYITAIYNLPSESARRQMKTALKRGVACGILKKNGVHYSLPIDTQAECEEIATQELGLLDMYCRRRQRRRRHRGCKPRSRRSRRSRRGMCKCKRKRRSSRRRRPLCKSRRSRRRRSKCICKRGKRSGRRKSAISPSASKTNNFSLNQMIENNNPNECENSSNSTILSDERRDHGIPLSY
ncbi:hypothetical protein M0802_008126 [Mischocyttarus mexicanus]|nr:hypothetical protein M0802_008126 [Mischocyttarus mexicanus]